MTTCPDCGKEFADDGLHLCARNWYTGNAPAINLTMRGPVPNDDADATGGLSIGIGCTNPKTGCLDFLLEGRHVVISIADILAWSDGDTSTVKPGDERLVITLLAKSARLSLQLAPSPPQ